jgi:OOP family OmpA-OmpF porin
VGPEAIQLEHLQERVDTFQVGPEEVSAVLAEAVHLRTNRDKQLTNALLPTVETALQVSVARNPRILVDILFPLLGPSIRKAITVALRGMIEALNRGLEISLSLRGLQWRLEAVRTGKAFAEVVLLHTLRYQVEQVLLIHKETGLLLQHVVAEAVPVQDGAMVSGMLTAIQDFMHDSFGGEEGESLATVEYGDRTLWIEQGPYAILAGVVRNVPPRELQTVFQEAVESIHFEMHEALRTFQGDAEPFEAIRPHLEACLQQQFEAETQQRSSWGVWCLSGALLLGLGWWGVTQYRAQQRWTACLQSMRSQPGTVVFAAEKQRGGYQVSGLLDPLAPDPLTVPAVARLCTDMTIHSQWQTYYALHPTFVAARARQMLAPPDTVTLRLENHGILQATGEAPYAWTLETRRLVRLIPGVTQLDIAHLTIPDHPETVLARARATLAPPDTVALRLEDGALVVSGVAPHVWITTARQQALTLAGVQRWREEQLTDSTLKALQTLKAQIEAYAIHFSKGTIQPEDNQEATLMKMA